MSKLQATRTAQRVLSASFEWGFGDTMADTAGATKNFGSSDLAIVSDVINLPMGAQVVGGEIVTYTAFDAATYTVKVGDSADDDRYLAATDVKAAGRVALVPTGFTNPDALNLRLSVAAADACTAGKARVTVLYVVNGRADEVYPN